MTSEQNNRLTAENYTPERLQKVLVETEGLLGIYEVKEYERLQKLDLEDFIFEWIPFKMDNKTGRVKLRPNSNEGVRMLERARAQNIMNRNPWIRRYHAIKAAQQFKRERKASHNHFVQDFTLRYCNDERFTSRLEDLDEFVNFVHEYLRDDFTRDQLAAVARLIPRISKALSLVPPGERRAQAEEESSNDSGVKDSADSAEPAEEETQLSEQEPVASMELAPMAK